MGNIQLILTTAGKSLLENHEYQFSCRSAENTVQYRGKKATKNGNLLSDFTQELQFSDIYKNLRRIRAVVYGEKI